MVSTYSGRLIESRINCNQPSVQEIKCLYCRSQHGSGKSFGADLATFNDATLPALSGVSDATVSSIAGGDGNVIIGTVTSATSTVTEAILSTDNGNSFATVTLPTADKWSSVAYGKDINTWVMLAGTADATSNNALGPQITVLHGMQ